MGITGLSAFLKEMCPDAFFTISKKSLKGKKIAIDSSIMMYQFMIQIRTDDGILNTLEDAEHNTTSHIQGFFNAAVSLISNEITPVFVFDGKCPDLKYSEISRRREIKEKARIKAEESTKKLEKLRNKEEDDSENEYSESELIDKINKANKQNVIITKEHFDSVKTLLKYMGVSVIESPGEAEAQCTELLKAGLVDAVATDDTDSLVFGCPISIKKFSSSKPVKIILEDVLDSLEITHDQFIDFCILCGCDYSTKIKGIGPKNAYKLIKQHETIEKMIPNLSKKFVVEEEFLNSLDKVRNEFKNPLVTKFTKIETTKLDTENLIEFLTSKNFNENKVLIGIERLSKKKTTKQLKSEKEQPSIVSFLKKKE